METNMTTKKALDILERHDLWRRGADYVEAIDPKLLGMALDKAIEVLRSSDVSDSLIGRKLIYQGKECTITDKHNTSDFVLLDDENMTMVGLHWEDVELVD